MPSRNASGRPLLPEQRTLVVSADEQLLDDLLRLAAAAGVEVDVVHEAALGRPLWTRAALVLVGADLAVSVAAAALPRRGRVALVTADLDDAHVWRRAVEMGAEHVAVLPDGEPWLVERMAQAADGADVGAVVGVVGGRGGAGASTLAVALAFAALRRGVHPLLVDGDPLGGGLDLVLGGEDAPGPRWPDLAETNGRLSPQALGSALPDVAGPLGVAGPSGVAAMHVLSWDRGDVMAVPPRAMEAVLDAAPRIAGLVVVDLPRRPDAAAEVALARCDVVLLVVPAEVRAVASAARVAAVMAPLTRELRVVVRGPAPSQLEPDEVAASLRLQLAGSCRAEPGLADALERGEPPGRRRGPLARLADVLLDDVLLPTGEAA